MGESGKADVGGGGIAVTHSVNSDTDAADPGALASLTYVLPEAALKSDAHTVHRVPKAPVEGKQKNIMGSQNPKAP